MSRKGKFDLNLLVHAGVIKAGDKVFFVSDGTKSGSVSKQSNGDYKINCEGETISVHATAQKFLGQDPPNHASQWLRTENGKTLYQLWQNTIEE